MTTRLMMEKLGTHISLSGEIHFLLIEAVGCLRHIEHAIRHDLKEAEETSGETPAWYQDVLEDIDRMVNTVEFGALCQLPAGEMEE